MTADGLRWQSIVDFVVLAPFIYLLLRWSRDARALRVTIGILGLEVGADRMLSTNRIVRESLLELRRAAQTLAQDLDDESTQGQ